MFQKILIANRGEIAVRIIRACRGLGIRTVAVYSEVDQPALYVQQADESYPLGDPQPQQSYLNIPKLIEVARQAKVDAIHPGYGFLSENARFAEACAQAGIVFIGPTPAVIKQMGDKIGARNILKNKGFPLVPGTNQPLVAVGEAVQFAAEAGYPVLLKAAAGGGGKGMRVVQRAEDLPAALEGCQREAKSAFGDDRVFLEKYLLEPRHVEIQIIADQHGNVRHLFERECSIQRRHQKVIEETPSPALDETLRQKMGEAAVKIARLIGYQSVGTIEFILDKNRDFYFLEVNTRLQVEHPITEMITGVDLVKAQIRIAAGEKLDAIVGAYCNTPLQTRGHAIECRICAEDPENNFLPSIGKITHLREPAGDGVRVDSGIFAGWEIPVEYDPMLAKLIVHAPTRPLAIRKMLEALGHYEIDGVKTNIPFLRDLLRHPEFSAGQTDTGFIPRNFPEWVPGRFDGEDPFNPWQRGDGWRLGGTVGAALCGRPVREGNHIGLPLPKPVRTPKHALTAPMPGKVIKISVVVGDTVKEGDLLVVMEAMKMEHSIQANRAGIVKQLFFQVGDKVGMGEKLVEIA